MLTSKLRCHYRTAPCASGTLTEVYILKHMPAMGMMSEMCVCHQTTASKQLQMYSKCNQALSIWHVNGAFLFRLASCGGDRSVFSWDVATGHIIRKFRGHDGVANSVSISLQMSPYDIMGNHTHKQCSTVIITSDVLLMLYCAVDCICCI